MSAESSKDDQPEAAGQERPGLTSPARAAQVLASRAERWGALAMDPIRRAKAIAPLSSFASLGPRKTRRPLIIAGITVLGLLGGAGAALATTGSATPAASHTSTVAAGPSGAAPSSGKPAAGSPAPAPGHSFGGPGRGGFRFGGPMAGGAGLGGIFGALHGQAVVAKQGGGYQTVAFQRGKVTAISATSITLRSADGYSHTYTITSSTLIDAQRAGISSVKTGNQVSLIGTVSGSSTTAVSLQDLTLLQQGRAAFGFRGGNGQGSGGQGSSGQGSGGQSSGGQGGSSGSRA